MVNASETQTEMIRLVLTRSRVLLRGSGRGQKLACLNRYVGLRFLRLTQQDLASGQQSHKLIKSLYGCVFRFA